MSWLPSYKIANFVAHHRHSDHISEVHQQKLKTVYQMSLRYHSLTILA